MGDSSILRVETKMKEVPRSPALKNDACRSPFAYSKKYYVFEESTHLRRIIFYLKNLSSSKDRFHLRFSEPKIKTLHHLRFSTLKNESKIDRKTKEGATSPNGLQLFSAILKSRSSARSSTMGIGPKIDIGCLLHHRANDDRRLYLRLQRS